VSLRGWTIPPSDTEARRSANERREELVQRWNFFTQAKSRLECANGLFAPTVVVSENIVMWEHLRKLFKQLEESNVSHSALKDAPPEPTEFAHPGNRQLFEYFRQNSAWNASAQYEVRTHSDLTEILFELVADSDVRKGYTYGRPVVANGAGLIFAWAGWTSDFFLRLVGDKLAVARAEGARSDPTYPPEWVNFYMNRLGPDWGEILQRWARISYEETLTSGPF
jgi:hypothetical protein